MPPTIKYGVTWPSDFDELQIEMQCIRYGGKWKAKNGKECVEGLSFHYHRMRKLIWPELDDEDNGQRWHKLCRDAHCENDLVVMAGPASSAKTHESAWFYLCDWWCDPENTLTLVSSTDMRGLRNRVWGEICSLWEKGKKRFPYLAGHLIDSRVAITFRDVEGDEDEIAMRDMRQAIQGIPTMQGGKFVGISKFLGLKQKRVRLVADEAQCFVAGTKVITSRGEVPIESVKVGDFVRNPYGLFPVTKTFKRPAFSFVIIRFESGRFLVCTPNHPILTEHGWVKASSLPKGIKVAELRGSEWITRHEKRGRMFCELQSERLDSIKSAGFVTIPDKSAFDAVYSVYQFQSAKAIKVFNLEVAGHPSYCADGVVVHNCMGASFLSSFSNLSKNGQFKSTVLGNPTDIFDPLGKAAEPIDGWDGHLEPEKTSTWRTKFMDGLCINLIGTDSPNFDFPPDKAPFKYLIDARKIALTLTMFTKDSWEYYSQCVGVFKIGTMARRVLTRKACEDGKALTTDVVWAGERQRVHGVDAAYGGDRCIGGWAEFGKDINGNQILYLHPQINIPISLKSEKEPEEQIAEFVKRDCESNNVPPENMGHDSTGRGTLGTYIARAWSAMTNPIEFGGVPTDRPVTSDMFITDPKTRERRLKKCNEHYVKFVTELWFTVRYAVMAGQIRGLSEEAMEEFCQREWDRVSGDRIELETKTDMKERIGRSPDLADHVAILVEMARRRGFKISKMINEEPKSSASTFIDDLHRKHRALLSSKEISHT